MRRLVLKINELLSYSHSLITLLLFCFCSLSSAYAADNDQQSNSGFTPLFVKFSINSWLISKALLVLRNEKNEWLIPTEALKKARVKITSLKQILFNGESYFPVSEFKDAIANLDEPTQVLDLTLGFNDFIPTIINTSIIRTGSPSKTQAGFFMNYDLSFEHGNTGNGQAAFTEFGAALKQGVALSNFAVVRQPENELTLRLDSNFTIDRPETISTIRFGDAITKPATSLGRAVRFGGIQFGTNFQTQPQMITMPMATASGQAALPSTVDIFVNNVLQSRKEISPGPFSISSLPMLSGEGELQMIVRDLSGRQEVISQRIYSSPTLLAEGLSEFSVEAGALRKNYGIASNDYGDLFASGSYRRGMTSKLTLEGAIQAQQGGPTALFSSSGFILPGIGKASIAFSYSHSEAGNGVQTAIDFDRRTTSASFSMHSQIADDRYRQSGVEASRTLRRLDSANFSYRINQWGAIGLGAVRQQIPGDNPTQLFNATFSTSPKQWGSLIFSVFKVHGTADSQSANVFWILPIERGVSSSVLHSRADSGASQTLLQMQKNALPEGRLGFRLQTGINVPHQAALLAQNQYGQSRLEVAEFNGNDRIRMSIAGAIVNMEKQWFASKHINESFGLIKVSDLSNVRVYVNNQFSTRTNKDGFAFLPRLQAYVPNHISIEQLDLPLDTAIDAIKIEPIPAWRSGIKVEFPVRHSNAASMRIISEEGTPVPVGAVAMIDGQHEKFPVGREGEAYLTGLNPENTVRISWLNKQCSFHIFYVAEKNTVPYLGEFLCTNDEK
jgi:outer membrane usher protein